VAFGQLGPASNQSAVVERRVFYFGLLAGALFLACLRIALQRRALATPGLACLADAKVGL
jgi:hypothetical protein